jgi:hypothetical protein
MSQTTVEKIFAAAQHLSSEERRRLAELLHRDTTPASPTHLPEATTPQSVQDRAAEPIPASTMAEMQWLLDHPDFWEQHRGEHVALSGYQMIAVGKTRKEVVAAARRRGIRAPFVQYLPQHEGEWLLGFSNQKANNIGRSRARLRS